MSNETDLMKLRQAAARCRTRDRCPNPDCKSHSGGFEFGEFARDPQTRFCLACNSAMPTPEEIWDFESGETVKHQARWSQCDELKHSPQVGCGVTLRGDDGTRLGLAVEIAEVSQGHWRKAKGTDRNAS